MRIIKISKFIAEESEVNWLIKGLLPNVGWTLFYAIPGTGKSTFAAQMCLAMQEGTPFLGMDTIKTNIMFIQADSIELEWQAMLRRIAPHGSDGLTVVDVKERVLGTPSEVVWLRNCVEKYNPGYIVFDSLQALTAWTINTDTGSAMAKSQLQAIAGHIPYMIIHHPPHNDNRPSGHNSLAAGASNVWALLNTRLKVDKGRLVKNSKIDLKRDENGLWYLKPTSGGDGDNNISYTVLPRGSL